MIFDTHAHYDHKRFNSTRDNLLNELYSNNIVKVVNPAIDYESNFTMQETLQDYSWIYFAVGIHPKMITQENHNNEDIEREESLRNLVKTSRVVAIGETGLDYHYSTEFKSRQILWFHKQIQISQDTKLPLILHIREADNDAINILKEYSFNQNAGIVHCFNGDYQLAKTYLDMGFLLGIGGTITYPDMYELQNVIKNIPLSSIVLETDSPFVKPLGWIGKNNSLSLPLTIKSIADIKNVDYQTVEDITFENASKLFKI